MILKGTSLLVLALTVYIGFNISNVYVKDGFENPAFRQISSSAGPKPTGRSIGATKSSNLQVQVPPRESVPAIVRIQVNNESPWSLAP